MTTPSILTATWATGPLGLAALLLAGSAWAAPIAVPGAEVVELVGTSGEFAGYRLESGFINDDAHEDLLVSAPEGAGIVRAYFGPIDPTLSPFAAEDADVEFVGNDAIELGWAMETVDINDDGHEDVVLSAASETTGSPARQGVLYIFLGPITDSSYDTDAADITIEAPLAGGGIFGWSLASGDLNGDSQPDLVVGDCGSARGHAFVLFSTTSGRYKLGEAGTDFTEFEGRALMGCSVAVGSFNGDGYDDLVIGAYGEADLASLSWAGTATMLYGRSAFDPVYDLLDRSSSHLASIDAAVFFGRSFAENVGFSLEFADMDRDGLDELLIGAPYAECQQCTGTTYRRKGSVYMVHGRADSAGTPQLLGHQDLMVTSNVQQFVGENDGDQFGFSVAHFGTAMGTVSEKFAVGAPGGSKAYLVTPPTLEACSYEYNEETGLLDRVCLKQAAPAYTTYVHSNSLSYFGAAVLGARVVDHPLYVAPELIVAAPFQENVTTDANGEGRAYLFQP